MKLKGQEETKFSTKKNKDELSAEENVSLATICFHVFTPNLEDT